MYLIPKVWKKLCGLGRRIYGMILRLFIAECGGNFVPGFPLKIIGGENIKIGRNFRSMGRCHLFADKGELTIGDDISLNINVLIGASGGKIHIGNNVLIGPNVVLRAADHGTARSVPIQKQPHKGGLIAIEDDVWISSNAVILRDVRLGKGCVVAAGAVVTTDVEPYSIVGGVPARKISERV
ncbi:MAG: acyltransferase [Bacteroidetes bacterium]|nr:acyltransferase [Bacteroidota bacterium]